MINSVRVYLQPELAVGLDQPWYPLANNVFYRQRGQGIQWRNTRDAVRGFVLGDLTPGALRNNVDAAHEVWAMFDARYRSMFVELVVWTTSATLWKLQLTHGDRRWRAAMTTLGHASDAAPGEVFATLLDQLHRQGALVSP